jgi:8-oxo-dGTP diphosphatase
VTNARPMNVASFAVIESDGRIVLVRRNYGMHDWALPGGALEGGETIEQALHREVLEETGLNLENAAACSAFAVSFVKSEISVAFVFSVDWPDLPKMQPDAREISAVALFSVDEARSLLSGVNRLKLDAWARRHDAPASPLALIQE